MSISHLLEAFEEPADTIGQSLDDSRADQELAIFERGYKAGWEDCDKAAGRAGQEIDAEFTQRLRELSFTFHEAQTAMLASLEPFANGLLEALFPALETEGLKQRLGAELSRAVREQESANIVIRCHPSRIAQLQSGTGNDMPVTARFETDPELGKSTVMLNVAQIERKIDIEDYMAGLRAIVAEFFADLKKETQNV